MASGSNSSERRLQGEDFHDVLIGNAVANNLAGREGDDKVKGRGGDDFLTGGHGIDSVDGGRGSDWCYGETLLNCELIP
jgi:Ca2+-binding RTX toxin-like protein